MTRRNGNFSVEYEREEDTIEVMVEWEGYYQPAKISGPPEDCYPEDGEIDILSIIDKTGNSVDIDSEFEDYLIDKAWDEFHSQED